MPVQTPILWQDLIAFTGTSAFECSAIDSSGTVYAGGFTGSYCFLAKYPSGGNKPTMVRVFNGVVNSGGNSVPGTIKGIVLDSSGNYFITGVYVAGTLGVYFGTVPNPTPLGAGQSVQGIFIAKFDASDVCQWAVSYSTPYNTTFGNQGYSITLDNFGHPVVVGLHSGIDYTQPNVFPDPSKPTFIYNSPGVACVCLDKDTGALRWNIGNVQGMSTGVATIPSLVEANSVVIAGQCYPAANNFGLGPISTNPCEFLVKLDGNTGTCLKSLGFDAIIAGGSGHQPGGLATCPNGDVLWTSAFSTTITFGTCPTLYATPSGNGQGTDIFFARLDHNFNCLWSLHPSITNYWYTGFGYGAASDSSGNMMFCGEATAGTDFGGFIPAGNGGGFIAIYTPAGSLISATLVGAYRLTGIAIGPDENPVSDGNISQLPGIFKFAGAGSGISPPNPCNFTAVYAPTADGTVFTSKFGFAITSSPTCPPLVMPPGASNILVKYLFPTNTIFPTPNVETPATLLLNYRNPGEDATFNKGPTYGFYYKVTGGNGAVINAGLGYYAIGSWYWTAAWADASGTRISDWCSDGNTCQPGWVRVVKTAPQNPPDACAVSSSAVFTKNNGNIVATPYANLKTTTLQTARGPMQIVS